jgi:hypothetical protein
MELQTILDKVRQLGVSLTVEGDRIRYRPASRMPPDLVETLRSHKAELLQALKQHQAPESDLTCWVLEEWRRVSIHEWRHILAESLEKGDAKRANYARWMLREVLVDSQYADE